MRPFRFTAVWEGTDLDCRLMLVHPMREPHLQAIRVWLADTCVLEARMRTGLAENPFLAFRLPDMASALASTDAIQVRIEWSDSVGASGTHTTDLRSPNRD